MVDHGGFHSDCDDELDEFHSDNNAELNDSDIGNVLNMNNINLSAGIDLERKGETTEQVNSKLLIMNMQLQLIDGILILNTCKSYRHEIQNQ